MPSRPKPPEIIDGKPDEKYREFYLEEITRQGERFVQINQQIAVQNQQIASLNQQIAVQNERHAQTNQRLADLFAEVKEGKSESRKATEESEQKMQRALASNAAENQKQNEALACQIQKVSEMLSATDAHNPGLFTRIDRMEVEITANKKRLETQAQSNTWSKQLMITTMVGAIISTIAAVVSLVWNHLILRKP